MTAYLDPTQEAGRLFLKRNIEGEVVMLNLLRFREIADYSGQPDLAPETSISGAEAFDRYIEHTRPFLAACGGEVLLLAGGGSFLIGPSDEQWDLAMLVRQSSVSSFMSFASNKAYLAGLVHRTAGVKDARLLPLVPLATTRSGFQGSN